VSGLGKQAHRRQRPTEVFQRHRPRGGVGVEDAHGPAENVDGGTDFEVGDHQVVVGLLRARRQLQRNLSLSHNIPCNCRVCKHMVFRNFWGFANTWSFRKLHGVDAVDRKSGRKNRTGRRSCLRTSNRRGICAATRSSECRANAKICGLLWLNLTKVVGGWGAPENA
jgi:hypothetical protein